MRKQIEQRLQELKLEMSAGQKMLQELEARGTSIRESMLRISGGIQVLEEELAKNGDVRELTPSARNAA